MDPRKRGQILFSQNFIPRLVRHRRRPPSRLLARESRLRVPAARPSTRFASSSLLLPPILATFPLRPPLLPVGGLLCPAWAPSRSGVPIRELRVSFGRHRADRVLRRQTAGPRRWP